MSGAQAAGVDPADVEDIVFNAALKYLVVVLRQVRCTRFWWLVTAGLRCQEGGA